MGHGCPKIAKKPKYLYLNGYLTDLISRGSTNSHIRKFVPAFAEHFLVI